MNRPLALLAVGLVLGGLTGFLAAAGNGITLDGHDHGDHSGDHSAGSGDRADHAPHGGILSLPEGPGAPRLHIEVTPDPASGWNLKIVTDGFRFAPERASTAHVPGEGHAHVYVDGEKIARQYGSWLHISGLAPGERVIAVTLNANDHRMLAVGGKPLRAETKITVPE